MQDTKMGSPLNSAFGQSQPGAGFPQPGHATQATTGGSAFQGLGDLPVPAFMQNRRGLRLAIDEEEKGVISDGEDDFNQVFGHALSSTLGSFPYQGYYQGQEPPQPDMMSSLFDTSQAQQLDVAFLNSDATNPVSQAPGTIPDDENQLHRRPESADEEYPDF
jgi:hypothetical protein